MSKDKKPQVMILCEDKAHLDFIKGFLAGAGWHPRSVILQDVCPPGSQSAEQWVRQRFGQTLRTFRGKHRQRRNIILLVMIDGDNHSPAARRNQLQGDEQRAEDEPVAIFVPRRNIQSWMAFLDRTFADETTDYKNRYQRQTPNRKYGERLSDRCGASGAEEFPESLQDACGEWARLTGN